MVGEKVSSKKNIYVSEKNAVLKISSNKKSDEYGYATTLNGNITKINGNTSDTYKLKVANVILSLNGGEYVLPTNSTLDVTATENGSYIYVYILNKDGKYEKNYTAVNLILIELEDKTIYVGEGKTVNIDNIGKVNSDNLKFENIKDSSIIKIDNNTITGLKAGETSFTAKEKNTNATSLVTVKVVKLEFEKDYGTVLLGSSKSVKLTGINNGAVSVRTSDNKIATVSLVDNQVIITPKSVGNVDLTISETNANTSDTYKLKVANVILSPNGGEYVLPTNSTVATVKTLVKVENANSIETSWSDNLTKWEEIVNNKEIIRNDLSLGKYNLCVRIDGEEIYKSKEFVISENENTNSKIIITPDKVGWSNSDVTATVTYGSILTENRKGGFGTTLDAAKTAAATSTAASVTATENGYFYAEATDAGGNKVTTSLQITTIAKIAPDATFAGSFSRSDLYVNSYVNISVACSDKGGSGLNNERSRFYIDNKGTTDVNVVDGTDKITNTYQSLNVKTPSTAGTYYVHVIVEDNAGNVKTLTSSAIEVKGMKIGNYVKYNLSYKDMISGYTFTENNGWRILDLSDSKVVKLVSTGVPVKFNYSSSNIKSSSSWSSLDTNQYEDKFYASGDSNLYAATGLYFNFENIKFGSSSNAFMYGSVINGNNIYSGDGSIFKTNGATSVRALTLSEINHARNFAKKLALNEDPVNPRYNNTFYTDITTENDAAKGLFKLNDLGTYSYSASTNAEYMVASPYYRRLTGSSDIETALIYINNESVSNYTNSGMYGLRVVVEIPKDQFDLEIEP